MNQSNGYWILGYSTNDANANERTKEIQREKAQNKQLSYCLNCKKVWQFYYTYRQEFLTYTDMPTYGLKRQKCRLCTKEK